MKIHKKKEGIEFSFTWLFAVIIGAFILFLAIYAATKIISMGETETGTVAAKEIGILLNPLEISFESAKATYLSLGTETRIYNGCDNSSVFGSQKIQTSQKTFGKFSKPSIEMEFPNKYIFSGSYEEGKNFGVFSKPFDFPYKVADMIYLISSDKKYCFVNPPESIKEELKELKQNNLLTGNCSVSGIIKVCFDSNIGMSTGCNVSVRYNQGYVEKNKTRLYFETDALMYGAIFSDKKVYECQIKRLMSRAKELGSIYEAKTNLLSQKECNSNLDLSGFKLLLSNYDDSSDLSSLFILANSLERENDILYCRIW